MTRLRVFCFITRRPTFGWKRNEKRCQSRGDFSKIEDTCCPFLVVNSLGRINNSKAVSVDSPSPPSYCDYSKSHSVSCRNVPSVVNGCRRSTILVGYSTVHPTRRLFPKRGQKGSVPHNRIFQIGAPRKGSVRVFVIMAAIRHSL
jgi:hypothetical protein